MMKKRADSDVSPLPPSSECLFLISVDIKHNGLASLRAHIRNYYINNLKLRATSHDVIMKQKNNQLQIAKKEKIK